MTSWLQDPTQCTSCTPSWAFSRPRPRARALLEVRPAAINYEDPNINTFALQLSFASLLQRFNISGVRLRNIVDAGAMAILHSLPVRLALLLGQRIEALRHRLDNLTWGSLDQQLSPIKVRQLHRETT